MIAEIALFGYMAAVWFTDGQPVPAVLACVVSFAEIVGLITIVK